MESTENPFPPFAPNEVEQAVLELLDMLGHMRAQAAEIQRRWAEGERMPAAEQLALYEKLLRLDPLLAELEGLAKRPA